MVQESKLRGKRAPEERGQQCKGCSGARWQTLARELTREKASSTSEAGSAGRNEGQDPARGWLRGDLLQLNPCVAPPRCDALATPTHAGIGTNPTLGKTGTASRHQKDWVHALFAALWGLCKPASPRTHCPIPGLPGSKVFMNVLGGEGRKAELLMPSLDLGNLQDYCINILVWAGKLKMKSKAWYLGTD